MTVIDPIWQFLGLHVPGEPKTKINFMVPVDAIFYIRNADNGYLWKTNQPTSICFHPLMTWATQWLWPKVIPYNIRFWVLSLVAGLTSTILIYSYSVTIGGIRFDERLLFLLPLLPGGVAIATGNVEFLCLTFTTLLTISIIKSWPKYLPAIFGSLAILAKPNALCMIPVLIVYFLSGFKYQNKQLQRNSFWGFLGILGTWVFWILVVDLNVGHLGAYWQVREYYSKPLDLGALSFLAGLSKIFIHTNNAPEQMRYLTALAIPLVDMWILLALNVKEVHRLAILAGILGLFFIIFVVNNPNKVIVYSLTTPGHFASGLLFLRQAFSPYSLEEGMLRRAIRNVAGIVYILFCFCMAIFFILGTPLEWYY